MSRECLLAKVLVISGGVNLGDRFDEYFVPKENMYVFYSSSLYDPVTGNYSGIRKLHDRIKADLGIPDIDPKYVNYVSIDIKSFDRSHTYLTTNRRGYQLSEGQLIYIRKIKKTKTTEAGRK